jgi:Outer membrane protein beta-barrel domain
MKPSTRASRAVLILPACWLIGACAAYAQDQPVQSDNPTAPAKPKHFSVGIRLRDFPLKNYSVMGNNTTSTTTFAPQPAPKDWNFTTTTHSAFWGAGISGEYWGGPHWTISAEVIYNRLAYTQQTNVYWGVDNPATTYDERSHEFFTESTHAYLFDVPVLVHYRSLRSSGPLSRLYFSAGPTLRYVASIKSSLYTILPSDSNTTTTPTVNPSRRTVVGGTVGVGFRIVDDFNIKTTPEIRYTRWTASTFSNQSTISPRNQIEVGIGFTF